METARLPDLRERHRGERRELIERAASRVFMEKGFREASMADVAREAGISAGSIYTYFAGKGELVFAVAFAEITELEGRMAAAVSPGMRPMDELRAMVAAYVGFYQDRPSGFAMLLAGLERASRTEAGTDAVIEYDRRAVGCLQLLHDVLERGMAEGQFHRMDAWEGTRAIWSAVHGSLQLADVSLLWDADVLVGQTVDLLINGINAEGKA